MTSLITLDDIKLYLDITANADAAKVKRFIHQAQLFDLKPAIGDAMYFDLLANFTVTKYQDLLNGKSYTDLQDQAVAFEGLKPALAHWAYARYKENSGVADTNYGSVTKRNDYSDPVTEKSLARIVGNARSVALGYWQDCVKYLNVSGVAVYALWNSGGCADFNSPSGAIKISAVGDEYFNYPTGHYERVPPIIT